tara:strand:- start:4621 stop:5763 length:1143 start_codon:yes stop_codon:yes gene_type:complete
VIDWTAQQNADLVRAQNIAANTVDLGVLSNRAFNQFGPGIINKIKGIPGGIFDKVKGIPANILDKAQGLFSRDKTGKKNTDSIPGTPEAQGYVPPEGYVPGTEKAREGKEWIDEANALGITIEELAQIRAKEDVAKEFGMTPEEMQHIIDNKLHKKDNPKYNKNKQGVNMAQGWFPGKHLAQGIGNVAGRVSAIPGNIKARGNPMTNQTGLFQGGEQGRVLGRFRDAMQGGFQQGRGGNPILQAKANEGMSTPTFRGQAQGMIPPFNFQGPGGSGGGMLDGGSQPPGGGMPGVGTEERKAEYDRRGWAYDETIPGYGGPGGLQEPSIEGMIDFYGGAIDKMTQPYQELGGYIDDATGNYFSDAYDNVSQGVNWLGNKLGF